MSLTSKRLLIVTGKGGVGKSTVAAALGLAAAAVGHRVAVVELAGQTRMPRLFGLPARTDGRLQALHPNLESLTIDPARVLEEELAAHLPVRAVARGLAENRAVATIASAAPGLRELLALSAVANLLDGPHDLAVVDGPATGHALGLVDVPETVAAIARMGPVRSRADRLGRLLADGTATAVVLVSTPDELSVSETLEAWDELAGRPVTAAGVIANMVLPALFEPGDAELLDALPDDVPPTGRAAIEAARGRMGRTALERERLDRLPAVLAELPLLFGEAIDRNDVIDLSELLEGVVTLATAIDHKQVVVCAGAGGVGKTTCAAAIGLAAADRGRRVLVMTIDPARRLAGALGLPDTGDEPHRVEVETAGELHALMLDAKRTFDRLITTHAPTPERAERILDNRIYRHVSVAVTGSQEYMAMERLWELHDDGGWDLIVLDTPPARNALDFLEAPGRVMRFIDGRALRMLLRPGLRGLRALGSGTQMAMRAMERMTGIGLLDDVAEFLAAFDGMYDGFRDRAEQVAALLASDRATFMLVTSPEPEPIGEAEAFWQSLMAHGMPFGGAILNKVQPRHLEGGRRGLRSRATAQLTEVGLADPVARRAAQNLDELQMLATRDAAATAHLRRLIAPQPLFEVPRLDHEVDDLDAVAAVAGHLAG